MTLSPAKLATVAKRLGMDPAVVARCFNFDRQLTAADTAIEDRSKRVPVRVAGGRFSSKIEDPARDLGPEPVLTWLPKDCIFVDKTYQRPITREGWTKIYRIVREFRWSKFQPITVAGRDTDAGLFALIDGQHRWEACKLHPLIDRIPSYAIGGGVPELEAASFVSLNRDRIALTTTNVFFAQLAAGDPTARLIKTLCDGAGITVARMPQGRLPPLTLSAVKAMRELVELGEEVAERTLYTIAAAKPDTPNAFSGRMLACIGEFIADMDEDLNGKKLVDGLKNLDFGWALAQAVVDGKVEGRPWHACMLDMIQRVYDGKTPKAQGVTVALPEKRNPKVHKRIATPAAKRAREPLPLDDGKPKIRRDAESDRRQLESALRAGRVTKCPTAAVGETTARIPAKDTKAIKAHNERQEERRRGKSYWKIGGWQQPTRSGGK
jgi:ParB-like nuclease domain